MKQRQRLAPRPAQRRQAAESDSAVRAAATVWTGSPRMAAQRAGIEAAFGTAQRAGVEEEEPLQGRFEAAQRAQEEDEMQMKADPAQRVGEEDELQMKALPLQRAQEEDELQMKADPAGGAGGGLPAGLRAGVESLSGMDLSDVNVHANSSQPAQLDALAYAQGNDIHLAPGQEQHLPHEAWHVVQQRQGRVAPTMQMAGTAVNDDAALEAEADTMGERALQAARR